MKEYDDLMSATRYAVMMLRYARTAQEYNSFHRKIEYPRSGYVWRCARLRYGTLHSPTRAA